jgi:midasin (ATPase involved in ribosome maturation)
MELSPPVVPAVGSALAALIAGGVAYVVAVLSKEQKTSEFRQAWIDALRSDISELIAGRTEIALAISAKKRYGVDKGQILDFLFKQYPELVVTKAKYHRILLRLNPAEHQTLIAAIQKLESFTPLEADEQVVLDAANEITRQAQIVLKAEWERVKKGETVFRWTKRVAIGIMAIALVIGVLATSIQVWRGCGPAQAERQR